MLRIHTGLRKWSKRKLFDLHLKKINLFDIRVTCIKISNSELLFEQYRMALNQDKYYIEVRNDDAIKRSRIFFYFMLQISNRLEGLHLHERYLLIDTIMKDRSRKQIAEKI